MVSVERQRIPRLIHDAVGRHPAATVKAIRLVFCARHFVIAANHHFLMTSPHGEQQFVVQYAERVAQQPALRTCASAGQRVTVIPAAAAKVGAVWLIDAGIVVDVGDRVIRCF
ncbi:hypothetical protein D3C87_1839460 [compost metagenome]